MGLTSTQFRTQLGLARDERRSSNVATAKRLRDEGKTLKEIAASQGIAAGTRTRSAIQFTDAVVHQNVRVLLGHLNNLTLFRELLRYRGCYLIQTERAPYSRPQDRRDPRAHGAAYDLRRSVSLLFFDLFENLVEGHNLVHDGQDVLYSRLVQENFVVLVPCLMRVRKPE